MPVILQAFEKEFGCAVLEGYGLSETSPVASFNQPGRPRKPGTIGFVVRGCEMRIVDDEGNDVPDGEPGEIAIRDADGYYTIVDRKKDLKRGGCHGGSKSGRADSGGATSEHGTQLIVGGRAREERGVLLVEGKPGLPVDQHRVGVLARLVHDHSNVGLFGRTVDGSPLVQRDQHGKEGLSGCGEHVLVPRRTLAVTATLQ
jgi:acyl-CoA synthetase (AMP-forming)/AMP-acid ligase II